MRTVFTILLIIAISCIQLNQIGNLSLVLSQGGANQGGANWTSVFGYDLSLPAALTWAIGIELGVLVSVLAGAKKQAMILALGSCVVNLLANQVIDVSWSHTAAKIVIYALSSYLLWYFCELFALYYNNSVVSWFGSQTNESQADQSVDMTPPQFSTEQKGNETASETNPAKQVDLLVDEVAKERAKRKEPAKKRKAELFAITELICPHCQRADFKTQNSLNAHVGRCKKKHQDREPL